MQLITDGPDIPPEILTAHEEDRLVMICGAGISMLAGLPSFQGLTEKVICELGAELSCVEKDELQKGNYDRVLGLLAGDGRLGSERVRVDVQKILAVPPHPDLTTHTALLSLATSKGPSLRLVTTNFDLLFEAAAKDLRIASAPVLPIPKPYKWNSLVHLHGRIDMIGDPHGRNLVLTSSDFGLAYLVERWASRFVCELFNHFTVLFVGYNLSDPVMRYLVDALAAERHLDDRIHTAFAFASHATGNKDVVKEQWRAKGIEPILYNDGDKHVLLHKTLSSWAYVWEGGFSAKKQIVSDVGVLDPDSALPDEIGRLRWALSETSGTIAEQLSELGTKVSLKWMKAFEKDGLLNGTITPTVRDGQNAITTHRCNELNAVSKQIVWWLSAHWSNPELILWVVRSGGFVHSDFAYALQSKMAETAGTDGDADALHAIRRIWRALIAISAYRSTVPQTSHIEFWKRLESERWSPSLRIELLAILTPRPRIRPSWKAWVPDYASNSDTAPITSATDLVVVEHDNHIEDPFCIEELRGRSDCKNILAEIAFHITGILRGCLDDIAALDGASDIWDTIYIGHPSIAPHEQNRPHHDLAPLIDLVRDSFDILSEANRRRANVLTDLWIETPYPLFRRLVLYAAKTASIPATSDIARLIVSDPYKWMWDSNIQREFYQLLPKLWIDLTISERTELAQLVVSGPSRDMYRSDRSDDDWARLKDWKVWNILARLDRENLLDKTAQEELKIIQTRHPKWTLTGAESEDFASWLEIQTGDDTDYTKDDLLQMTPQELAEILNTHEHNRDGLLEEWRQISAENPSHSLMALRILPKEDVRLDVWSNTYFGIIQSNDESLTEALDDVLLSLETLANGMFQMLESEVASIIRRMVNVNPTADRSRILKQWDRLLPVVSPPEILESKEWMLYASNSTVWTLAEILLALMGSKSYERDAGLPKDVADRLERLLQLSPPLLCIAAAAIAQRLSPLFHIASDWVKHHLAPLFDWESSECAQAVWQGYLLSPSVSAPLWEMIKPDFLQTFEHIDELQQTKSQLPQLLAVVAFHLPDSISNDETRKALRQLDDTGRAEVIEWILIRLRNDSQHASDLWSKRITTWFRDAWPKELPDRGTASSELMAQIPLAVGEAFKDAVEILVPLMVPFDTNPFSRNNWLNEELIAREPDSALALLNAILSDSHNLDINKNQIRGWLDQIMAADSSLQNDERFRRLSDSLVRKGIR